MSNDFNSPSIERTDLSVGVNIVKPRQWPKILMVMMLSLFFWYLEFIFQYYFLIPGELQTALVRSFGLAGATIITGALLLSIMFKFWPRSAYLWHWRRYFGVTGFILIFYHVATALKFDFNYDFNMVFFSSNPLLNPMIFGVLGYLIFLLMAIISSDFAMQKLTPQVWKFIQRFVYVAEVATVAHFLIVGRAFMNNLAGYVLYGFTLILILGQIYWWIRISKKRGFKNAGFYVGAVLLLASIIIFYFVYKNYWQ